MSSYRPITDTWILARAKLKGGEKYYGAYPGGFLERARALLGVHITDSVLHVCGGRVRAYPYPNGWGPNDRTLDLDETLRPDYLQDAREKFPFPTCRYCQGTGQWSDSRCSYCAGNGTWRYWPAILMDPPYTEPDAEKYAPGKDVFPTANRLLRNALDAVRPGGRVGLLCYSLPQPPPESVGYKTRFIANVQVVVGFNNRCRVYSVFEREYEG